MQALAPALALGLVMGAAPVALAQPTPINQGTAVDPSNIDWSQTGSLTIHKKLNPETTGTPTGETSANVSGQDLPGVEFTIQRIVLTDNGQDVPFNTNAGFTRYAQALSNGLPADGNYRLEPGVAVTTGADGQAVFNDLELGAYWVTETDTSGANVDGALLPSAPFVAFVPMTDVYTDEVPAAGTSWNYNPVAYPKNSSATVSKTVVDAHENVGDTFAYTLTGTVPAVGEGRYLNQFYIEDLYDNRELEFNNLPTSATLTPAGGGAPIELPITGELVAPAAGDVLPEGTNSIVRFDFAQHLEVLGQNPNATITINLVGDVLPIDNGGEAGDGIVTNGVREIVHTPRPGFENVDEPTEVPGDEVNTYLAKLEIFKYEEATGAQTPLQGAQFDLYECSLEGVLDQDKGPLTVNGQSNWTTDENGLVVIDGLHVTDFENNVGVAADYQYCLVETVAPTLTENGETITFELREEPIPVEFTLAETHQIDANGNVVTQRGAEPSAQPLTRTEVQNVRSTTTYLPSTGGMGVLLLLLVGAAVVAAGAYGVRRANQAA